MNLSRRDALLATLFGAGSVGLRAIATGLPASLLLEPRKALADSTTCTAQAKAQFVVFSTSYGGDPLNANVPGTYEDPKIIHPPDPAMAPTQLTLQGAAYTAAKPWSTLPQNVLDRTVFFHMATGTPVHPKEPQVLSLMGATNVRAGGEMLPSLLARATGPCLGTVRTQPISFGGDNPTEQLSYMNRVMPNVPPTALRDTLTNPVGPLTDLQGLRDQTMNQIYDIYKNAATPTQQQFIDQMATTQTQARELEQDLLDQLSAIKDNSINSQFQAALVAIRMKLAPLVSVHASFGGDNHGDANLQGETSSTVSSVAALAAFLENVRAAGLEDQVSFMSLNVFGRTLAEASKGINGRDHNGNHQVSLCIGKPFRGGVIGGCAPAAGDYGATSINSSTGAGGAGGDIQVSDTLAAFGQTMLAAVGGDPTLVTSSTGKVVAAALA